MVDSFDPEVNYFDMAIPNDFPTSGFFQSEGGLFQHGDFPTSRCFQPGGGLFQHGDSDMVISLLVDSSNPEVDYSSMVILIW